MAEAKKFHQYSSCIIASGLAISTGIAFGWTCPNEKELLNGDYGFPITVYEFSWIAAVFALGGLISCIPSGFLIDILGRQFSLVLIVIPTALGWFLIRISTNIWVMCTGRFVLGMVSGLLYIAIPLYTCEIAQNENRGFLGMLFQLQSYAGVLFVYTLGAFADVKSVTMVSLVVPMMLTVLAMQIPESPAFLLQKGKEKEARRMLKILRGSQYDMTNEMTVMQAEYNSWMQERKSFFGSLKSRACIKALYITCGLMCFQQLCGLGAIMFYATGIFREAKTKMNVDQATITVGLVQFVTKLCIIFFADKMGRRFWLLISIVFVALANLALGLYFSFLLRDENSIENLHWIPITALCVFVGMFSFGLGSIPWIMIGELFPPNIKGVASSIPISIFWFLTFLTTKLFVDISERVGMDTVFFIFFGSSVFALIFTFFLVPETRGKSFNEILQILEGDKN